MSAKNRGQIWTTFLIAIMMLVVCGLLYILLDQVYEEQLAQTAINNGVYAPNAQLIDYSWKVLPIPVVLVYILGQINESRRRMGGGLE